MVATVVFGSGKGGVGKSTVVVNIGAALARDGHRVGLVDTDVYGPDVPAMLGITRRAEADSVTLWDARRTKLAPVEAYGMSVMSTQFLIGENQSMDWHAMLVEPFVRRLVRDTDWGDLDLLLVDLPPGTGDIQQTVLGTVPEATAVLVVTPQHVSHLDSRKLLAMLNRRDIPVAGAVENMVSAACPHCGEPFALFPPAPEPETVWAAGVVRLGGLPFAPHPTRMPVVLAEPESPLSKSVVDVARRIRASLE